MSNGFSAADMSTAAANGFRDGLAAQPGAAQEAVAWSKTKPTAEGAYYVRGFNLFQIAQYEALVQVRMHHFDGEPEPELVCNIHESTSNADMDDWSPIVEMSEDFEWLGPLYTAPVAAAPVEPDLDAYDPASGELAAQWLYRNGFEKLASVVRGQLDIRGARIRELKASTPAAPGIDLEKFRNAATELTESTLAQSHAGYCRCWEYGAEESRCDCGLTETKEQARNLLALIDASPKGGSTDENIDLLPELRDVEDYFTSVDPNPIHLATVRQAISAIVGSPKGGSSDDFGAMTDLLARWRHNASIESSPNMAGKARREVWVQCLGELEFALQATSAEVGP